MRARRNPIGPIGPWREKARKAAAEHGRQRTMTEEYNRILELTSRAYEAASPEDQERFRDLDERFRSGDHRPFIAWARSIVPGAFRGRERPRPVKAPPRCMVHPVEPLDDLPGRLYHGTRDLAAVLTRGLDLPSAEMQGSGDGTWCWKMHRRTRGTRDDCTIEWGSLAWRWYQRLSKEGRRSLQRQTGSVIGSIDGLGEAVSLFWTTESPESIRSRARDDSPILELDPRRLPVFGWFEPDMLCKDEVVLVLPAKGWQGGPDAFTAVWTKE